MGVTTQQACFGKDRRFLPAKAMSEGYRPATVGGYCGHLGNWAICCREGNLTC